MVKFARRDFTCWSDIHQSVNERCVDVCKALGEMITGSGTGWEYDERTPENTYIYIPSRNSTYNYPVSYFVNSISGAKLMVLVNIGSNSGSSTSIGFNTLPYISNKNYLFPRSYQSYLESNSYSISQTGINIAMIPSGSNSVFPSSFPNDYTTKFLPDDALPIITEVCHTTSSSYSQTLSMLGALNSSYILSYGLLIDSEFVMLLGSFSSTANRAPLKPLYAIGKIIGTVAHEEDNRNTSQYGAIRFCSRSGNAYTPIQYSQSLNSTESYFCGRDIKSSNNSEAENFTYALCYDINGVPLTTNCYYGAVGQDLLTPAITNESLSGQVRRCPFAMATMYNVGNVYITEGDGFKGYLDTNLFRNALCTKGNYYNNGAFVSLDNNLLVAWDKDATDNIM